ncbi:hypothetical protein AUP07_0471 [methanogenic archaeon mixed culture ISO4-G1]|nr:hypothetical protein AUP07_0471 [methanogenic archaeon mixed culture ISO4-G1]
MIEMSRNMLPAKCRVLQILKDNGAMWTSDISEKMFEQKAVPNTNRWKWVIRFYLLEMQINGMVKFVDTRVADPSYYQEDEVVETKYQITKFGLQRLEDVLR